MTCWTPTSSSLSLFTLLLLLLRPSSAIRVNINTIQLRASSSSSSSAAGVSVFREAPAFRNGEKCGTKEGDIINVTMTLDDNYLRGTMAAVLSILQHSTCPENLSFHFLSNKLTLTNIFTTIKSTFPNLNFNVYHFNSSLVKGKISKSVRQALDQPLNYARIYLPDIIPVDVNRVIYLDSDIIVVDDIQKLWEVEMEGKVVAAPEYCHVNLTQYFTNKFWSTPDFALTFVGRKPCYFNTGVMVMDLEKWRNGDYRMKVEKWMLIQKQERIYNLGSLPPFLLVLGGDIKAVDHRWNQHGLGGDNFEGKCRKLHPGSISLLHWSGKGKPWLRLDSRRPCVVDHLWEPYDLYRTSRNALVE